MYQALDLSGLLLSQLSNGRTERQEALSWRMGLFLAENPRWLSQTSWISAGFPVLTAHFSYVAMGITNSWETTNQATYSHGGWSPTLEKEWGMGWVVAWFFFLNVYLESSGKVAAVYNHWGNHYNFTFKAVSRYSYIYLWGKYPDINHFKIFAPTPSSQDA